MKMTDEGRLLVLCSRIGISECIGDEIRSILRRPLDWKEILQLACWHAVAPLLCKNLKAAGGEGSVPAEIMAELKRAYQGNLARNLYFQMALKSILEAFHEAGIRVILLKGAALAPTLYGDIGLRPMSDMDLLVRTVDLPRAEEIMNGLAYVTDGIVPLEELRAKDCHICYSNSARDMLIEIHWHVLKDVSPPRLKKIDWGIIEEWWKRARPSEAHGEKAFVLSPHDSIMLLSLHFLKHRFIHRHGVFSSRTALIQLCDIFESIKRFREEIQWTDLRSEAVRLGLNPLVHLTLGVVGEILGKGDDDFQEIIGAFGPVDLDRNLIPYICRRIFIREDEAPAIPSGLIRSQSQDSSRKKVKVFVRELFPSPQDLSQKLSIPLSSKSLYLHYLIRPFTLLAKYRKALPDPQRVREEGILKRWINAAD
jgi:hypothetical protein